MRHVPSRDNEGEQAGLLTLAEAASRLRCSVAWLRKLVAGGIPDMPPLPVLRIGSKKRIREETLHTWLLLLEERGRQERQNDDWLKHNDPDSGDEEDE